MMLGLHVDAEAGNAMTGWEEEGCCYDDDANEEEDDDNDVKS